MAVVTTTKPCCHGGWSSCLMIRMENGENSERGVKSVGSMTLVVERYNNDKALLISTGHGRLIYRRERWLHPTGEGQRGSGLSEPMLELWSDRMRKGLHNIETRLHWGNLQHSEITCWHPRGGQGAVPPGNALSPSMVMVSISMRKGRLPCFKEVKEYGGNRHRNMCCGSVASATALVYSGWASSGRHGWARRLEQKSFWDWGHSKLALSPLFIKSYLSAIYEWPLPQGIEKRTHFANNSFRGDWILRCRQKELENTPAPLSGSRRHGT